MSQLLLKVVNIIGDPFVDRCLRRSGVMSSVFTGGECLFDLLHRGGACESCKASEIHDCLPGVHITLATADLRVLLSES